MDVVRGVLPKKAEGYFDALRQNDFSRVGCVDGLFWGKKRKRYAGDTSDGEGLDIRQKNADTLSMSCKMLSWVLLIVLMMSCSSTDTKSNDRVEAVRAQIAAGSPPVFNPNMITKENKELVRTDADKFVSDLNRIIQRKDYSAWIKYLEPKYREKLESKENLIEASRSDRLRQQHIILQNLFDYFINVVVPSRSNLRVDDIEFIDQNTVKTFMIEKGQRLRIYELERYGDSWRIVR